MSGCFGSHPYDRWLEKQVDDYCDDSVSIDRSELRDLEKRAELAERLSVHLRVMIALLEFYNPSDPAKSAIAEARAAIAEVEG